MRGAFVKALIEVAEKDNRVCLLTGDLGYMALEPFVERFPDRFFNVGVSEQNMVGMATGLAEAGFIPYVYSIVTFASLRAYEFIRNGPILHQLPVRIVGIGGGLEYGHQGLTHWGLEDVGVMRVQPGITIIAPADHEQTKSAVLQTWNLSGPIYFRLGKDDRVTVPGLNGEFELGHAQLIRKGDDTLIISMGGISAQAAIAADLLGKQGVSCGHLVVASVNPVPTDDLIQIISKYKHVMTVEAHYSTGGLGSMVAELIAEHGINTRLTKHAIKQPTDGKSGSQKYLYDKYGISEQHLVKTTIESLNGVLQ